MNMLRQGLTLFLAAALIWVGVAGGLLSAQTTGNSIGATPNQHVHEPDLDHAHRSKLMQHDLADNADRHEQSNRECARSCLGKVAVKLVPAELSLQPPQLIALPVVYTDLDAVVISVGPGFSYWPAAPPDLSGVPPKGAARLISRHSHLRI
ncbi:MAG: hypothetical protein ACK5KM_01095 [Hyphomicrobiaceae bacterium]